MEDDVAKISTIDVFMNFPESYSAKDLFQSCKQYGHIVDTFIPTKRSKTGKRFGFVRFINVFNEGRLVNNICTVWIDRSRLHANIARWVVLSPALVLSRGGADMSKDLSKSLFGRVKQFASITNLRTAPIWNFNTEVEIAWVEVKGVPFKLWSDNTFKRIATKWGELLDIDDQDEMCFYSKRLCIYTKTEKNDEELNDDVSKEGELKIHEAGSCGEDSEMEEVMETIFEGSGQKNNLDKEHTDQKENYSEDPFDIYKLLNKKEVIVENEKNSEHSLKYPQNSAYGAVLREDVLEVNLVFCLCHSDSVVWRITGKDLLIIAVYAPHDNKDKQMLWDYLTYEIAITLERYLSDHRPILLRESHFDYGPTPFRFFHYWIEMEGFSKVVEDAWREGPCDDANAMNEYDDDINS
ncbi:RNA-directed DNA polymerase, eukaryota [Tanacetum coccineum]